MPNFKRIKCQKKYAKNPKNQVCGKKCRRAARSCPKVLTRVRQKSKIPIFHFFQIIQDFRIYRLQDYKIIRLSRNLLI